MRDKPKPPVLPPDLGSLLGKQRPIETQSDYQGAICGLMEQYLRRCDPASARASLQYWIFALVMYEAGLGPGVPGQLATEEARDGLEDLLAKYRELVERLQKAN